MDTGIEKRALLTLSIQSIAGHVSMRMLEHCANTRLQAKRRASEELLAAPNDCGNSALDETKSAYQRARLKRGDERILS